MNCHSRFLFFLLLLLAPASGQVADPPWRFTFKKPEGAWSGTSFDDRDWKTGPGGFGEPSTPDSRVATFWRTSDIWMRRTITLDTVPARPALYLYHDEDAEVFLNGTLVASFQGFNGRYQSFPIKEEFHSLLKKGNNLIAVHCSQTTGGQFIDVHLIEEGQIPKLPKPATPVPPLVKNDMITPWGEKVTAGNAWQEYPRPQLKRDNWTNLNGKWNYAITRKAAPKPKTWQGEILVPFAVESKLSGVQKSVTPRQALWYQRTFTWKPSANHTLLNFEAVDYQATVWVNDQKVGTHTGGNLPFSFDITSALQEGENTLTVKVLDATDSTYQLHGKQRLNPQGIWYTPVTGIWQTVWLEQVPQNWLSQFKLIGKTDGTVTLSADFEGPLFGRLSLKAKALLNGKVVAEASGSPTGLTLKIPDPQLWSPSSPTLYDLELTLGEDKVTSYFGLRETTVARDQDGHLRLHLNGHPLFHWGTLDQGWWPDGLLTPPSEEAMVSDIRFLQDAGFNTIRKHIKVEPRRYYYHCDRMGMMVWQDQVSAKRRDDPPWPRLAPNPPEATWPDAPHDQFMTELKIMVDTLHNHPSIVQWVPFNERWGQHRTISVGEWITAYDPTRQINIASGGNFFPVGHLVDHHEYPHPGFPFQFGEGGRFDDFVKVVGEFGGHGFPVDGHLWNPDARNWGYGGLPKNKEEWIERYQESIRRLADLKKKGIAAGIYTQTTDVEGEINGLITYDRRVRKLKPETLRKIHLEAGIIADPSKNEKTR